MKLCGRRGCYGPDIDLAKLKDFHRRKLQVLVEAGADLVAFETIPNKLEAQVHISRQHFYSLATEISRDTLNEKRKYVCFGLFSSRVASLKFPLK